MTFRAEVFVTLKEGVLDPQGNAVRQGLEGLGFTQVDEVRIGKYILLRLEAEGRQQAQAQVEEMCRRLLANPVMEEFRYQLIEEGSGQ